MKMKTIFKQIPTVELLYKDKDDKSKGKYYKLDKRWIQDAEMKQDVEEDVDPDYKTPEEELEWTIGEHQPWNVELKITDDTVIDWDKMSTMYFHPSCTVPRFKLQAFCADKKVKSIRDKDKADVILYGSNFSNNIVNADCSNFVKRIALIKRMKKHRYKRNLHTEIIPALEAMTDEYIVLPEDYQNDNDLEKDNTYPDQIIVNYNYIQEYDKYVLIQSDNFYHQDNVLAELGSGAMDDATYRRLCDMFSSKDQENHVVAMEVMSNCNYKESIVYLLELMRRYYGGPIFNSSERKHVSFKALRLYLQYEPRTINEGMDSLVKGVIAKGLLTEANYKLILALIEEKVNKDKLGEQESHIYTQEDSTWILTGIDLAPEYKALVIWDKKQEPQLIEVL